MSARDLESYDGLRRRRSIAWVAGACVAVAAGCLFGVRPVAGAQNDLVTITGGADESAHNYTWTVMNRSTSPIVYLEFPHYRADTFMVPPAWAQKCTFLANVGVEDRPGVCTATAPSGDGIMPGQSAEFGMRITGAGANVGRGEVRVRFADGKETVVADVALPEPTPLNLKYVPLIGLAALFIVVVVIRELRRRRTPTAEDDVGAGSPQDS